MRKATVRRGGEVASAWAAVVTVASNWERMLQCGGDPATMPLRELVAKATTRDYLLQGEFRDPGFAQEASRAGVSEEDYPGYEARWLAASREAVLPQVLVESQGLTLAFMPKEDPRGVFLGAYTGCCQHPDGAGESCAWDGVENPSSGFLVLTEGEEILAQSWVWQTQDVLVLDNIEDAVFPQGAEALYKAFASEANALGYEVRLGLGHTKYPWVKTLDKVSEATADKALSACPAGYTDAERQVYLGDTQGVFNPWVAGAYASEWEEAYALA